MRTLIAALVVLATTAFGQEAADRNKIEGTWENVRPETSPTRQLKVINQDHFMWMSFDRETKYTLNAVGGSYTLDGDTYKERIEFGRFGTAELQKLVGTEQTYHVDIDGDRMVMTGDLTIGGTLREVWRRVSSPVRGQQKDPTPLKAEESPKGDELKVVSVKPASPAVLKLGERMEVELNYFPFA